MIQEPVTSEKQISGITCLPLPLPLSPLPFSPSRVGQLAISRKEEKREKKSHPFV